MRTNWIKTYNRLLPSSNPHWPIVKGKAHAISWGALSMSLRKRPLMARIPFFHISSGAF